MREIKFRAWDCHEMLYDIFPTGKDRDCYSFINDMYYKCENIMQYTGLKDKNGKMIFEGDIIDIHQTVNGCNLFIIEWNNFGFTIRYAMKMTTPRLYEYNVNEIFEPCKYCGEIYCEVIGNIYENPELLEVTNEQ